MPTRRLKAAHQPADPIAIRQSSLDSNQGLRKAITQIKRLSTRGWDPCYNPRFATTGVHDVATETKSNLGVKTIDHVTLVVADLEKSRAFYAGLLGMEEKPRPDFGFSGAWFEAGATQIHLNIASEDAGTPGLKYDAGKITRALHVAFLVDDANDAADMLRAEGVEIIAGPRQRPDGAVQLYIFDPDGHQIEITSAPPA